MGLSSPLCSPQSCHPPQGSPASYQNPDQTRLGFRKACVGSWKPNCLQREYSWPRNPEPETEHSQTCLSTHLCPSSKWSHKAGTAATCTLGLKELRTFVFHVLSIFMFSLMASGIDFSLYGSDIRSSQTNLFK